MIIKSQNSIILRSEFYVYIFSFISTILLLIIIIKTVKFIIRLTLKIKKKTFKTKNKKIAAIRLKFERFRDC
jgi:hypothetical protein